MARRHTAEKRQVTPDPRYNSEQIARLISYVMESGKKAVAQRIVYGALDQIREKVTDEDALTVVSRAIDNIRPRVEVRSRRVGGSTYQVPVEVNRTRQLALALRWLVQFSNGRKGMPMQRALAAEILDAYKNQGNAVRKREDTHRMAQANRAFAHYAW
ncbi:MAG: 30S ribosomal protein S7 [Verrucomicrobia bacterium]|nr:30S ribosomal protein S7 [Verrucomicrobiota bacterium]